MPGRILRGPQSALPASPAGRYDGPLSAAALRLMTPGIQPDPQRPPMEPLSSEATIELLERVKQGDEEALDRLLQRCIPALQRWAHGRLPSFARGVRDTVDLVQDAVIGAIKRLDRVDVRHQGALQ